MLSIILDVLSARCLLHSRHKSALRSSELKLSLFPLWKGIIDIISLEKIKGGAKDNRPLFLNNRLLFLLFFSIVFQNFRMQTPFRGAPPAPPVAESQSLKYGNLHCQSLSHCLVDKLFKMLFIIFTVYGVVIVKFKHNITFSVSALFFFNTFNIFV